MANIYFLADGCGADVSGAARTMVQWARTQGQADLIVYGGDVYHDGAEDEFEEFRNQIGPNLSDVCALPGNHDWHRTETSAGTGEVAKWFDRFWRAVPPGQSQRPIDTTKHGSARYDQIVTLGGWRLIFIDTARALHSSGKWPKDDDARVQWLKQAVTGGNGRSKMVFTHHSRLSQGLHGDQTKIDPLWQALFDRVSDVPLVACTFGGHDHRVSSYRPRPRLHPGDGYVSYEQGIHIFVNGAGGSDRHEQHDGSAPDFNDAESFCLTRIVLLDERKADIDILGFGTTAQAVPTPLPGSRVEIRN